MIDTRNKRASAAMRKLPWMRRFFPLANSEISENDRKQIVWVYPGEFTSTEYLYFITGNLTITQDISFISNITQSVTESVNVSTKIAESIKITQKIIDVAIINRKIYD